MGHRATLYYTDHYSIPLPANHKFPLQKYAMLRSRLEAEDICNFAPAPPAGAADLELAHDPAYVAEFLTGTLSTRAMRRIGFPWSEQLVQRTLASAGGTLAATLDALANGFGATLAGGTHHAFRAEGSGFCIFNDIAVAIRKSGLRAAVVDLDVHQGDGTASIFQDDPNVLTLSLHGQHNFPFHKQRSSIDIALADGTSDQEYLRHLGEALPQVAKFRPEILFYQSGVDTLSGDRLGRLALSLEGLLKRDSAVFNMCKSERLPVVVTMGGGYNDPISRTVEAHFNTYRAGLGLFNEIETSDLRVTSYGVEGF